MIQAQTRSQVADGVQRFGVAPGARKMMDWEEQAAQQAIETGIYGVYRCTPTGQDCTRIGPFSKCFCGHLFKEHTFVGSRAAFPRCNDCACAAFRFVPTRPEEVGDWWLVRRKGFNVHTWRAKCRCGHSHEEHDPKHMRCRCGCAHFQSHFACVACDKLWEEHETVFEDTRERLAAGRPVGEDFRPLANDASIRSMVFPDNGGASSSSYTPNRLRPAQAPAERAEKSVQIMHETSGGRITGQDVANRYGRVPQPPKEWLYMGGSGPDGPSLEDAPSVRGQQLQLGPAGAGARRPGSSQQGGARSAAGAVRGGGSTSVGAVRAAVGGGGGAAGVRAVRSTVAAGGERERQSGGQPAQLASGFRPVYD